MPNSHIYIGRYNPEEFECRAGSHHLGRPIESIMENRDSRMESRAGTFSSRELHRFGATPDGDGVRRVLGAAEARRSADERVRWAHRDGQHHYLYL
jgi:hypothetical protein